MTIRLSRAEYCLLNFAWDGQSPFGVLLGPHVGEFFNMSSPDVPKEELVEAIATLFSRGFIEAERAGVRKTAMTLEEIVAALDEAPLASPTSGEREHLDDPSYTRENACFYGLTQRGGEAWENFARPDWSRYICEYSEMEASGEDPPETEHLFCADPAFLERYFCAAYPAHDEIVAHRTFRKEILTPWQATYWKTLPRALHISFQNDPAAPSANREVLWHMRRFYRWT